MLKHNNTISYYIYNRTKMIADSKISMNSSKITPRLNILHTPNILSITNNTNFKFSIYNCLMYTLLIVSCIIYKSYLLNTLNQITLFIDQLFLSSDGIDLTHINKYAILSHTYKDIFYRQSLNSFNFNNLYLYSLITILSIKNIILFIISHINKHVICTSLQSKDFLESFANHFAETHQAVISDS
jgi:hypothetical protein